MYNKHLETFLKVASMGSFSAAAENLFISPSAVIQQMNALESELGVKLFERSRRGVGLTKAGEILQIEAPAYIASGKNICARLEAAQKGIRNVHFETNPENKIRAFDLLMEYLAEKPGTDLKLEMLQGPIWQINSSCIVEAIKSSERWQRKMDFLKLTDMPAVFGVSIHSPLAGKKQLSPGDMGRFPLYISSMLIPENPERLFSLLREYRVYYEIVQDYSPDIVLHAARNNINLLCPKCWSDTVFDNEMIPCDWDYCFEYGFFYNRDRDTSEYDFIRFASKRLSEDRERYVGFLH